jgi:DNA repair exonuclease SbcCD nuclease subunit
MKIIVIGDPHFKIDNIDEVNFFIQKIEELCIKEVPDLIVVLGDILHTHERLHTTPLNKAYEFINKMRKITLTIVLVGNHDMCNNQQYLSENHWMNGMKEWHNVIIVDNVVQKKFKDKHLVFVPYVYTGRFIEALNTNKEYDWKDSHLIFAHQEFYGCKMGAIISVEGDKWDEKFPNIISGHIHSKQNVGKNIYYCGSSMQNAFGESETNIIPIIKLNSDKTYDLTEIDLELPRKKIIYTDVNSIENIKPIENDDKIKISISGDYEDFKAFKKSKKYTDLIKSGTKVVFNPKKSDIKEEKTQLESIKETDFIKILSVLVNKEKNNFLYQTFELVVNNKNIDESDILFL